MEGEEVSGAQLIAQALRAQVRARGGNRQPAGRDSLQRVNVRGRTFPGTDGRGSPHRSKGGREVPPPGAGSGPAPGRRSPGRYWLPSSGGLAPFPSLPHSRAQPSPVTTKRCRGSSAALPYSWMDVPPALPCSDENSVWSLNSRCWHGSWEKTLRLACETWKSSSVVIQISVIFSISVPMGTVLSQPFLGGFLPLIFCESVKTQRVRRHFQSRGRWHTENQESDIAGMSQVRIAQWKGLNTPWLRHWTLVPLLVDSQNPGLSQPQRAELQTSADVSTVTCELLCDYVTF